MEIPGAMPAHTHSTGTSSIALSACQRIIRYLEWFTVAVGRAVSWLTLFMVLATCTVVLLRRGFDQGSIALQESVTYMHAAVFMLGAAYALKRDAQVRVDIFYRQFSRRTKAWVNSLGALVLLLPLSIFTGVISWDFVMDSWRIYEGSTDSGGLKGVFLLKSLLPLTALMLTLQGVASVLHNLLILMDVAGPEDAAS
jgi:TRAP-type mannitol/chloroaromatic compound transport system permease small subunit